MDTPLLYEFVVIFCLAIVVIYVCNKIKVPAILGFLLTGILCGPSVLGLVSEGGAVDNMAEIGIVMLMFTIGMEMSVSDLIRLKKPVFIGGTVQVFTTVLLFMFFEEVVGMGWNSAVAAGCVISLSSTAIVMSLLQQKGQVNSPHGRVSFSILLYQDLMAVAMMLAMPLLAGGGETNVSLHALKAVGTTIGILVALIILARKVVPFIMALVVKTRIRELFLMSTIGICFAVAYITSRLDLSLALGAFIAGMAMSESEYSHSALESVMPFKDIFTSIFFISVGMLLNLDYFIAHIGDILLLTLAVLIIKIFCGFLTGKVLGYPVRTAIIVAFALCQVGEFSFVLIKSGLQNKLFGIDTYQTFLATIILTMACTPMMMSIGPKIANRVTKAFLKKNTSVNPAGESSEDEPLSEHLIIIGFGITGQYLARAAKAAEIPYIILEMNPETVHKYKNDEPIHYGDAQHVAVLENLGLPRARMLAVVISDENAANGVIEIARHMNHAVHILTKTNYWGLVDHKRDLGADDVVAAEYEAAMTILKSVLKFFIIPAETLDSIMKNIKAEDKGASYIQGDHLGDGGKNPNDTTKQV